MAGRQCRRPRRSGSKRARAGRGGCSRQERRELGAKDPRQAIAMCAGEVLVGKTPYKEAIKAKKDHPDGAPFFHLYGAASPGWGNRHPAPSRRRRVYCKVRPARQFRPGASRRGRLGLNCHMRLCANLQACRRQVCRRECRLAMRPLKPQESLEDVPCPHRYLRQGKARHGLRA